MTDAGHANAGCEKLFDTPRREGRRDRRPAFRRLFVLGVEADEPGKAMERFADEIIDEL